MGGTGANKNPRTSQIVRERNPYENRNIHYQKLMTRSHIFSALTQKEQFHVSNEKPRKQNSIEEKVWTPTYVEEI